MEKHVQILAIIQIVFGVLGLLIAMIVFWGTVGGGLISQDPEAIFITSIVGTAVASFFIILSIPGIIGGMWLLKYKNWARILVLIIGIIDLIIIPIGPAIGIYTLWVLLKDETIQLFKEGKA